MLLSFKIYHFVQKRTILFVQRYKSEQIVLTNVRICDIIYIVVNTERDIHEKIKEVHGMPNKKQGQVKGAEKLLSQMAKLYGLSDRGLVQALTYMRGVEDGGAPQKKGE